MCLYPGNKFAWAERLGHVIICPKSQSTDLVNIVFLCRNHDDRDILLLAHLTADIKSIYLREHQIKYDQVVFFFQSLLKPYIASCGDLNIKS